MTWEAAFWWGLAGCLVVFPSMFPTLNSTFSLPSFMKEINSIVRDLQFLAAST